MKPCPICAEPIQDEAILCRFCGAFQTARRRPDGSFAWAPPEGPPISEFAVGSLIMGILWVYWIGSILALVLGYLAKREIAREPRKIAGGGLATAGIVLGWIGIATLVLSISSLALRVWG